MGKITTAQKSEAWDRLAGMLDARIRDAERVCGSGGHDEDIRGLTGAAYNVAVLACNRTELLTLEEVRVEMMQCLEEELSAQ